MELAQAEASNQSERLIRSIFDSMPQLGWVAQPTGHVSFYNRRFYEYTGLDFEDLQGWGWEKVIEPQVYPNVLDRWNQAISSCQNFEMTIPLRRHDGVFRLFLTRATPLFNDDGDCIRWVGVNFDIQDEVDRSSALARSERQFKLLADSLPDLVWIADCNFCFRYLNQRWAEYTGLTLNDGLGDGWRQTVNPEDLALVDQAWKDCLSTQEPFESEIRFRSADGSYRWFLMRGTPVTDDHNSATSWFGTCTDVHLKRQANEQLERLARDRGQQLAHVEALTESVIESISDAIVLADPQAKLNYLNRAARDMLRNQPAPASLDDVPSNKRNYDASGERLLEVEELPLTRALSGQLVNDAEMVIKSADGHSRFVSVSARPIIDKSGDFKGAVAVVRDISARKTAELSLQQALDEAVEANRLKSQFVANISHEIRTPMSGILGLSELLLDETSGQSKELAEHIFSSAESLMQLVNDLLDLSKAEAGKIIIKEEKFALEQLLTDVSTTFKASVAKKHIKLFSSVDEALPAEVWGDRILIRQVLRNLVQNAIKFTETGSVHLKADAEARGTDTLHVRFSVKDTGVGISPENQKKLFRLFVQVDGSTTRRHGGTGMGLALSKRIVEIMNGEIEVESAEGVGSTFSFTLPLGYPDNTKS